MEITVTYTAEVTQILEVPGNITLGEAKTLAERAAEDGAMRLDADSVCISDVKAFVFGDE